jgi:hypothetical protein
MVLSSFNNVPSKSNAIKCFSAIWTPSISVFLQSVLCFRN